MVLWKGWEGSPADKTISCRDLADHSVRPQRLSEILGKTFCPKLVVTGVLILSELPKLIEALLTEI